MRSLFRGRAVRKDRSSEQASGSAFRRRCHGSQEVHSAVRRHRGTQRGDVRQSSEEEEQWVSLCNFGANLGRTILIRRLVGPWGRHFVCRRPRCRCLAGAPPCPGRSARAPLPFACRLRARRRHDEPITARIRHSFSRPRASERSPM
jgi:hypothetical protein